MDHWPGSLPEARRVNTSGAQVVWVCKVSATTHWLWGPDCQQMTLAIWSLVLKPRRIESVVGKSSSSALTVQTQ